MTLLDLSQKGFIEINGFENKLVDRPDYKNLTTFIPNKQMPIHCWQPYLQGYSSMLVEKILRQFKANNSSVVLDPFCGVGTTLLTCYQNDINSKGFDISPLAIFVTKVKLNKNYLPDKISNMAKNVVQTDVYPHDLPKHDIFKKALSKRTVDEILSFKDYILTIDDDNTRDILLLALMSIIEENSFIKKDGAHYRYIDKPKSKSVEKSFLDKIRLMVSNIEQDNFRSNNTTATWEAYMGDARELKLNEDSIDFVITSPPYLNRDNYIAQYKLELFLMSFVSDLREYRDLTHRTLRSHVEAKYPDKISFKMDEIDTIISELDKRPISNPKIPEMIRGYFEDMNQVFFNLAKCTREGGKLAIVVGNSSWSGVLVEVDKLLSKIAMKHGFAIDQIMVTRYKLNSAQQIKRYGKIPVRESIIIASASGEIR